jgi:alkaline phosphatase D
MVLWTRLVGGLDPVPYPVRWQIASDEAMHTIVASGSAIAEPAWAHAVHVEPKGIEPDRVYWYRFMAGDASTPVARTRTAPPAPRDIALRPRRSLQNPPACPARHR